MAVDYFLKLDSINGESVDQNFKNQIGVLSFSWGGTQTTSVAGTGGSGAGKVSLDEFSITKYYDAASPEIFKAMLLGSHITSGTLSAVKSGANGKAFLTISFTELFVTSQRISASSEIPTETVSFSYNTIKVDYSKQNEQGNLTSVGPVSYDLKANKQS
jgi:type VI secretion system secreted protein Hcp